MGFADFSQVGMMDVPKYIHIYIYTQQGAPPRGLCIQGKVHAQVYVPIHTSIYKPIYAGDGGVFQSLARVARVLVEGLGFRV